MQFSKRLDLFGDEVFASLNQKRRELEAAGRPVWDLSVGTPDFPTPDYIKKALVDSCADDANWKYALHDKDELKQAVCDYYKRRFDVDGLEPDQVMSCRGTQEGMQYVCAALADPGDIALIPDPCYPVFRAGTQLAGATPYYYQLTAEHGFLPHVADIPDDVADKAKYMIVSLPANPVGSVGTPEVYEEIIGFAKKHDIVIVHDNAYADVVFEGVSSSFFNYPGAMDVGVEFLSLSKSFDVTGVRLSFLVGRKDIVQAAYKLRSQVDFGMFFAEQNVAIACLKGPLDGVERQRLAYKERRDALCDGLEAIGWERPNCHGTLFVWARLPHGRTDSLAFTLELMEKTGVIVTPGASFGPAGEGYVRFALVLPPEKIKEAVAQIGKADL
ncbi:MAG: aminotransferase class I/II-fold pyridoxal phosphate-dependent enzyme [Atopobiaceae bacterium]|jgi:LL-diaminopimelate aminotransferase|nr:aminotransferase class I/II-fold pyridoxal phosphate-dependent enzyme [Atopobiaceae bacterium]MCI1498083.1 aminotransferase class I/II-fold pyridoxal phosphate-dependent enzyme [Atopobiaceae bacterium]MCI1539808.1 aminotransferase class I/II-fold pyridoxal phosphate-dependent enzyme [Atopobiaceae bacterium]